MATIKIQGNPSGSGSVTLTAPNTNSARTVTFPDKDIDLGALGGAGTVQAWVNFNGTGTVAIRDGGNVSSITDNGTSNYTVNFTSSMASSNYAALATVGTASNFAELETLLTSSVYFRTPSRGSAFPDSDLVCVGVLT